METKTINWTFQALEMLAELHEYLSKRSQKYAEKYIDGLFQYTEKLKKYPRLCALCRNPKLSKLGYWCCTFKNHIVIYEIVEDIVFILAIIHSKRNPTDFEELINPP